MKNLFPVNYYYTKEQMLHVLQAWGVKESLPGKGMSLRICFPPPAILNLAVITIHDMKSTYGKRLYKVEMTPQPKEL